MEWKGKNIIPEASESSKTSHSQSNSQSVKFKSLYKSYKCKCKGWCVRVE